MTMITYRFEEIRKTVSKTVACSRCGRGRKIRRSRTFTQTLNPFNKNADGTVKTRGDIWRELQAEAEAWTPLAEHPPCKCPAMMEKDGPA